MFRAVVIAVAVAGCATPRFMRIKYGEEVDRIAATPQSDTQIAAPAALAPKPWKVGQWALYKGHNGAGDGYEQLGILAEDSCGFWIQRIVVDDDTKWEATYCVARPPADPATALDQLQVVTERRDGGLPIIHDFRDGAHAADKQEYAELVRHLTPDWPSGAVREDVTVPAGHFAQAVKVGNGVETRWSHPDVPFDGLVKHTDADSDQELVKYGDTGAASLVVDLAHDLRWHPRSRLFFIAGPGRGWLTGHAAEPTSRIDDLENTVGIQLTSRLDILLGSTLPFAGDQLAPARFTLASLRWHPLSLSSPWTAGVYLRAGGGYSTLDTTSSTGTAMTAFGPAAQAAIGWMVIDGRDWTAGLEAGDEVAFYGADHGVRHLLGGRMYFQLYMPPF